MDISAEKRRIKRKILSLLQDSSSIASILGNLELASLISPRRTYSKDSMIKALIYMNLKGIKSFRKLFKELNGKNETRRALGFDDVPPTHQNFSHFASSMSEDDRKTVDFVSDTIKDLADRYMLVLDLKPEVKAEKEDLSKSRLSEIKNEKLKQLANESTREMSRAFRFPVAANAKYSGNDLLQVLDYIATENSFTKEGTVKFKDGNKWSPSYNTVLRRIKGYKYDELVRIFKEFMKRQIYLAKKKGIITERKVTVAVDATDTWFYGDTNTPGVVNADHPTHGTFYAYKFVKIAIVTKYGRMGICMIPKLNNGEMHDILIDLIKFAKEQVNIDCILMDRGFYSLEDFNNIDALGLKFIIPMKEKTHAMDRLKYANDTLVIPNLLEGKFTGIAVRNNNGKYNYTLTNIKIKASEYNMAKWISGLYKKRWQIETDFRVIKKDFFAKTTSKSYAVRYFYFIFALILFNFWIMLTVILEGFPGFKRNPVPAYAFAMVLNSAFNSGG